MHIQVSKPKPSDELVSQMGEKLANKLVENAVETERVQLRKAQDFQENVVARENHLNGVRGVDGVGTCVARLDAGLYLRICKRHAAEIAADPQKFWLVTAPKLYSEFGMKPRYVAKTRVFVPGRLKVS